MLTRDLFVVANPLERFTKNEVFIVSIEPPMHRSGSIEPTSVFRATTHPCQISFRSVNIWENGAQKTCFRPVIEHGYALGSGRHSGRVWWGSLVG